MAQTDGGAEREPLGSLADGYIQSIDAPQSDGCFFCRYWESPEDDAKNHVVWRCDRAMVVMNRFPYTNGHLLIAPAAHEGELDALADEDLNALTTATRDAVKLLNATVQPHGMNIGTNLGRCAGAGVPDHVHSHIVPRWNGDTNYMAVVADVRVIPQGLESLYGQLVDTAIELGIRSAKA